LDVETVNFFLQQSGLRDIYEKVAAGGRITEEEALRLFESRDLNAVGAIADLARARKNGNRASYIVNCYINYSNYCILSCQFCAFARKKRDADGFELSTEQIVEKARAALKIGVTELHIVGGLHPSLPFSYYTEMLRALRAVDGRLQLKCFTAIEILHLAWLAKKSVKETLLELKEAGLDALTGGGAEIFRKEVRSEIARGKESAEEYLAWAGVAPPRCSTGTSNRRRTAWIICGICAGCRTRPEASPGLCRCPTILTTIKFR
jgi:aminodeoxyfutalosine synthase